MNVKPMGNHIFIQRVDPEEKSKGGIIIPDTAKEKALEGIVRAVGPGLMHRFVRPHGGIYYERVKPAVKEGDHVLVGKYTGEEVIVDHVKLLVVTEDDLLAVVTRNPAGAEPDAA